MSNIYTYRVDLSECTRSEKEEVEGQVFGIARAFSTDLRVTQVGIEGSHRNIMMLKICLNDAALERLARNASNASVQTKGLFSGRLFGGAGETAQPPESKAEVIQKATRQFELEITGTLMAIKSGKNAVLLHGDQVAHCFDSAAREMAPHFARACDARSLSRLA